MPEALPSGPAPGETAEASTPEARIEHLLVTGLDHYFAGDFEHAINLWTRVLFLDRTHDRARAYIERARSAQAERQRQSEAIVHQGLAAFDRGDVEQARALLSDARAGGGAHDLALGILGRIDRLDSPAADRRLLREARAGETRGRPAGSAAAPAAPHAPRGRGWSAWIVVVVFAAVAGVAGAWWLSLTGLPLPQLLRPAVRLSRPAAVTIAPDPLPVPATNERYLLRGRALFSTGRLREAIADLDRIPLGDPLRPEADRLRGQIQRELLAVAASDFTSRLPTPATSPPPPE
jgi:tetratricopeptide (TPR) repeat protein